QPRVAVHATPLVLEARCLTHRARGDIGVARAAAGRVAAAASARRRAREHDCAPYGPEVAGRQSSDGLAVWDEAATSRFVLHALLLSGAPRQARAGPADYQDLVARYPSAPGRLRQAGRVPWRTAVHLWYVDEDAPATKTIPSRGAGLTNRELRG